MPYYRWKGITNTGTTAKGCINAPNQANLQELLLSQGIALIAANPQGRWATLASLHTSQAVSTEQIADFFGNLALLVTSGVEIAQALRIVENQTKNITLKSVVNQLSRDLEQGKSLHEAMPTHPTVFKPFMIDIIALGEKTGNLGITLANLKKHLEQQQALRSQLKQAALSPLATLVIAVALLWAIFVFVVPQMEVLYHTLNRPLPHATRLAFGISHFLSSWFGMAAIAGTLLIPWLCHRINLSPLRAKTTEAILLRLPIVNTMLINKQRLNFLQTLHLFLSSGLPLLTALEHAQETTKSPAFKAQLATLHQAIMQGQTLTQALEANPNIFIDQTLIALIDVGENTGALVPIIEQAQSAYEQQLTANLAVFTTLFSPLLMIVVGLCIGGLIMIIYIPVFNLPSLFNP
jgi:type II secretory pathway component PulF